MQNDNWISVAERLPEPKSPQKVYLEGDENWSINVLAHCPKRDPVYVVAFLSYPLRWFDESLSKYRRKKPIWMCFEQFGSPTELDDKVTHWMPLPEPPK